MNNVFLLTGGNMGNRQQNLLQAGKAIEQQVGKIVSASKIYETDAWGKTDQQSFYNQVLHVYSFLSPIEILKLVLDIEVSMGRERIIKYGPRLIDIDILFYNNAVIKTSELTVPHPEIQNRRFALTPLAELAPDYLHPVLHKTVAGLLSECKDPLMVKPLS
ncbi:MAG: 2-amino-4-hydroxy-6-hydroxymethyldihydropteridine diphosphokinase [Chitinophagaceae bacterium]|nr:2-amino-4-hydroxy-6-hydroxymethyldihydropteridine diphosphokinase [Chitinophagaceae bacterium]